MVLGRNTVLAMVFTNHALGLAMGHLAKTRSNIDFDDMQNPNRTLNDLAIRPSLKRILNAVRPEVEIVLDIQGAHDWHYLTQPGAVRRIVMKLSANAFKYTHYGSITVSLRLLEPQADPRQSVKFAEERSTHVRIMIMDTGQGISPEYIRDKLFTAFSQENARGNGTGLGLSIVKSIVNLLQGNIDVRSIVNVGTIVTVTLRTFHHPYSFKCEADSIQSHEKGRLGRDSLRDGQFYRGLHKRCSHLRPSGTGTQIGVCYI